MAKEFIYSQTGYSLNNDRVMHAPFTLPFLIALSGIVWRLFFRATTLAACPRKVVALDCDNTLWDGVLGEGGVHGISYGSTAPLHRLFLHKFMLALQRRGLLLCLLSRNEDADVVAAFKAHEGKEREWLLRLDEHIVARRINWSGKYDNLTSLSQDLNLNIADMIMVDDSPVECGQVLEMDHGGPCKGRNKEPSGLCVVRIPSGVPSELGRMRLFFEHHWAFDTPVAQSLSGISDRISGKSTSDVDDKRTQLYREAARRNAPKEKPADSARDRGASMGPRLCP